MEKSKQGDPEIESQTLQSQIETLCQDLWWSSESDYPVEPVWLTAEDLPEVSATPVIAAAQQLSGCEHSDQLKLADSQKLVAKATAAQSWHSAEDKAQIAVLQQLYKLLAESVTQLQAYRYGEVTVALYILGLTATGEVAGVKTFLVET